MEGGAVVKTLETREGRDSEAIKKWNRPGRGPLRAQEEVK